MGYNILLNPVYFVFLKYYGFCKNNNCKIIEKDFKDKNENKILEIDKNISFQVNIKINSL